jgi:hypothetical protein
VARPQDQVSGQEQGPDSIRAPESDPIDAELQQRMERLPPCHPSSPYNADGSRKPPPPDLSAYELPIPGDPDYQPEMGTSKVDSPPDGSLERTDDHHQSEARSPEADSSSDNSREGADDAEHSADRDAADEKPAADSEADRSLEAADKPHIGSDGSWDWKGRSLNPEESHSADQAFGRWVEAEGRDPDGAYGEQGLTPAMRRIEAQLDNGNLVDKTEDYALKTPDRFKEKLAREKVVNPDKTVEELACEIHDAVRYTFIFAEEHYFNGYWAAQEKLEGQGYELEVRRNMWDKLEYKGINSRWRDPDSGLPFEIQFHTRASWEAKQETHSAYEKIEDIRTPAAEREQLRDHQKEVSARILEPSRVMEIPDYRKKAR